MTTKKMRLRSSKRNNKPKTPKRKTNKSFTKKRNSSKKEKKNSRRFIKQRGGEEIISNRELFVNIEKDFKDYISQYGNKKFIDLDLSLLISMCMVHIDPNFYKLDNETKINDEYSLHRDKIIRLFNNYITHLQNMKISILLFIYINVNNNNDFYYTNLQNKAQYGTQFINELLFDVIIKNLLERKTNFTLYINNDYNIPFTLKTNISDIIDKMHDDGLPLDFITLFDTKLNPSSGTHGTPTPTQS